MTANINGRARAATTPPLTITVLDKKKQRDYKAITGIPVLKIATAPIPLGVALDEKGMCIFLHFSTISVRVRGRVRREMQRKESKKSMNSGSTVSHNLWQYDCQPLSHSLPCAHALNLSLPLSLSLAPSFWYSLTLLISFSLLSRALLLSCSIALLLCNFGHFEAPIYNHNND